MAITKCDNKYENEKITAKDSLSLLNIMAMLEVPLQLLIRIQ